MTPDALSDHGLTADQTVRLDDLIRSLCLARPATLSDDLQLVGDLGYDSLGLLELVSAIETEFGVDDMPEDDALAIETVADLRRLLAGSTTS